MKYLITSLIIFCLLITSGCADKSAVVEPPIVVETPAVVEAPEIVEELPIIVKEDLAIKVFDTNFKLSDDISFALIENNKVTVLADMLYDVSSKAVKPTFTCNDTFISEETWVAEKINRKFMGKYELTIKSTDATTPGIYYAYLVIPASCKMTKETIIQYKILVTDYDLISIEINNISPIYEETEIKNQYMDLNITFTNNCPNTTLIIKPSIYVYDVDNNIVCGRTDTPLVTVQYGIPTNITHACFINHYNVFHGSTFYPEINLLSYYDVGVATTIFAQRSDI